MKKNLHIHAPRNESKTNLFEQNIHITHFCLKVHIHERAQGIPIHNVYFRSKMYILLDNGHIYTEIDPPNLDAQPCPTMPNHGPNSCLLPTFPVCSISNQTFSPSSSRNFFICRGSPAPTEPSLARAMPSEMDVAELLQQ